MGAIRLRAKRVGLKAVSQPVSQEQVVDVTGEVGLRGTGVWSDRWTRRTGGAEGTLTNGCTRPKELDLKRKADLPLTQARGRVNRRPLYGGRQSQHSAKRR